MKSSRTAVLCLAIAAAITAAAVPIGLQQAGASTTACGIACTSPYNESAGTGLALTTTGSSVSMAAASSTNSGQDWTVVSENQAGGAVTAGVLSSKLDVLYSGDLIVEFQYAPNGVPSDQCLAENTSQLISTTSVGLTMTQCGVSVASLWIIDQNNASGGFVDLISANGVPGYDGSWSLINAFAEPGVLTVTSKNTLAVQPLSQLGMAGTGAPGVSSSQMWADYLAPSQSALAQKIAKAAASAAS